MKTIAVLSGKGGTGKSTISTSLGYILGHCGFKTLLIDLDLFTHGITYYALADSYEPISFSLTDLFLQTPKFINEKEKKQISCIMVSNEFTNYNLFVLPSISTNQRFTIDLHYDQNFGNIINFTNKLNKIITYAYKKYGFEYIIIDTRGGTDHTSTGAAIAADDFIMVTEADKPSWEMGNFLIKAINEMEHKQDTTIGRGGFIINKNVLPSGKIELFLRKKWKIPHLGTIPFDQNAIRYFQENKIPIEQTNTSPFSREVLNIAKRLFVSEKWTQQNLIQFKKLSSNSITRMFYRLIGF